MIYVEIDGEKYPCEIDCFHTQIGSKALRIKSVDAPVAENGFKIYNNDKLVADNSDFVHLYREDGNIKEYTKDAEDIIEAEGYVSEIPVNPIYSQLSAINSRINAITPYTDTKTAYYGEIEKVFYGVPNGNVSIFFDNYEGEYSTSRAEDRFTVTFPRLEEQTNITVMVQ